MIVSLRHVRTHEAKEAKEAKTKNHKSVNHHESLMEAKLMNESKSGVRLSYANIINRNTHAKCTLNKTMLLANVSL